MAVMVRRSWGTCTAQCVSYYRGHRYTPRTVSAVTRRPETGGDLKVALVLVALAARLIDHGDGDDQPAATVLAVMRTPTKGQPAERPTRDDVLENITLYWLTNTGVSSARSYGTTSPRTSVPRNSPYRRAVPFPHRDRIHSWFTATVLPPAASTFRR